jgi:hypothetical protein
VKIPSNVWPGTVAERMPPRELTERHLFIHEQKMFRSTLDLLGKLVSVVIGSAAIAYVLGFFWVRGYLNEFRAPWLISALPTTYFLASSIVSMVGLIVGILLGIEMLVNKTSDANFRRTVWVLYVVPILVVILVVIMGPAHKTLGGLTISYALSTSFFLTEVATGAVLVRYFAHRILTSEEQPDQRKFSRIRLTIVILAGFGLTPMLIGSAQGARDARLEATSLPFVSRSEDWRLLFAFSERFIVVNLSEYEKPQFRFVDPERVESITLDDR